MSTSFLRSSAFVLLFLCAFGVSAEVYRWTDNTGRVHYSDRPHGDEAEKLKIKSKRTDKAALAQAKQDKLDAEQAALAEAQIKKEIDDEAMANAEIRKENCKRSKEALNGIKSAERLYVANDAGEREYLSNKQILKRINRAEKDVEDWCNDPSQNQLADNESREG